MDLQWTLAQHAHNLLFTKNCFFTKVAALGVWDSQVQIKVQLPVHLTQVTVIFKIDGADMEKKTEIVYI
jgi:hypothetical protein